MSSCALCSAEPASFALSIEMAIGDSVAFPAVTLVGDQCQRLLSSAKDDELAARLTSDYDDYAGGALIDLLRRRTTNARPLPAPSAALVKARANGYELLSEHTGSANELASIWPVAHRVPRTELGEVVTDEDDDVFMVASPWRSVTVRDVVSLLHNEMERIDGWRDGDGWTRVGATVFGWDETEVREHL